MLPITDVPNQRKKIVYRTIRFINAHHSNNAGIKKRKMRKTRDIPTPIAPAKMSPAQNGCTQMKIKRLTQLLPPFTKAVFSQCTVVRATEMMMRPNFLHAQMEKKTQLPLLN